MGGVAAAVNLRKRGIDFTVFEKAEGPGGVWWANTYPGCGVDTDSLGYSFSFMPYGWKRSHGTQPELQQYVQDVIDNYDIGSNFRFSTEIEKAVWDDATRGYELHLSTGEREHYDVLVSAVGMLSDPALPQWPGFDSFEGTMFHSSQWPAELDPTGKRVAVVGTGATAAQLVPALAPQVAHLTLYQREPHWVLPRVVEVFSPERQAELARGGLGIKMQRLRAFHSISTYLSGFTVGSKKHQQLEQSCRDLINRTIEDPALREIMTPTYPYGCKRPVKTSDFYPALNQPHVDVVPAAVSAVTPTGLVDVAGGRRDFDVVVLAVGFKATEYLSSLPVIGPDGVSLQEAWNGNPEAYVGTTVAGFPNLFIMYGPNTNGGGPMTAQLERQAELVARMCAAMKKKGRIMVTSRKAMKSFTKWVDEKNEMKWSALSAGCNNYYFAESGRNVTQWPMSHLRFLIKTKLAPMRGISLQR